MDQPEHERLARALREDPGTARHLLARANGERLSGLAYVVLQNRAAAERAAATGIHRTIVRSCAMEPAPSRDVLRAELVAHTLRAAIDLYGGTREIDPLDAFGSASPVSLDGRQRALAAAVFLAGLSPREASEALGEPPGRGEQVLEEAVTTLGSRRALEAWVQDQVPSVAISVGPAAMAEAARQGQPASGGWQSPMVVVGAAAAIAVLALAAALAGDRRVAVVAASPAPSALGTAAAAPPATSAPGSGVALEECGIHPVDTKLAYEGWLTLGQLIDDPGPAAATPVYALVTDGEAEWSGPTRTPWPPFRPQTARFGCALDPQAGTASVYRVAADWEPPELIDGCPASPSQWFAGYREIGGPNAFVLLPPVSTPLWAEDRSVRILARLSPGPVEGSTVTALARPLGRGPEIALSVDDSSRAIGTATAPRQAPTPTHYVWLDELEFPEAGCWVVSLAIDGNEVGSAVLPVRQRPG